MKRVAGAVVALVCLGGAAAALREPQGEAVLSAGEQGPFFRFGRRQVPGDNDPYVYRDLDPAALADRARLSAKAPGRAEARRVTYTLLVWQVYSILSISDQDARERLYSSAESLFLSLLSDNADPKESDPGLVSNSYFMIGAAWVGWKGSLDALARERLQKCAALREGQYRLAAEMLSEKAPYQGGLESGVGKLLDGDAASGLARIDDVLKRRPDDPSALYWRGISLLRLGRPADAVASFNASLRTGPKDAAILEGLAACHYALQEWKAALQGWEEAIALDPTARGRLQPFIDAVREKAK